MSASFTIPTQADWLRFLQGEQSSAAQLLSKTEAEQKNLGYFYTFHEICQQPWIWQKTCERLLGVRRELQQTLDGVRSLVLTGSGSSEYAGQAVYPLLRAELAVQAESTSAGDLLLYGKRALPLARPGLLVSLARSGNSPESCAAVEVVLREDPQFRHLAFVCNAEGKLATTFAGDPRVRVITLPAETNDQSLVMTSSFTSLTLAATFLNFVERPEAYRALCAALAQTTQELLRQSLDALARAATAQFRRVVYLTSGQRFGAARESALKMLEMTSGRIPTLCETYLSFRHGPMTYIQGDTLVVAYLSTDPLLRAYELDLLQEIDRKKLGLCKLLVGANIPASIVRAGDTVIECPGLAAIPDQHAAILDVVVGQLLGFFRCRQEGLRPDSPSEDGVIQRVVGEFPIHSRV
ncbi:MAG: tagatose-6-phosphate ketose isomerase [Acidobacteria bacterium]|nr:tagatose-6-phosphate ketose isomerase [Acidobacteriota bacterium]